MGQARPAERSREESAGGGFRRGLCQLDRAGPLPAATAAEALRAEPAQPPGVLTALPARLSPGTQGQPLTGRVLSAVNQLSLEQIQGKMHPGYIPPRRTNVFRRLGTLFLSDRVVRWARARKAP